MKCLSIGSCLLQGKYRIESVLGQGGFGITYLAVDQKLERRVAIKEFWGEANVHGQQLKRELLHEAKQLARMDHPNIVKVFDVFEENETAYFAMEYIEGGSVEQRVKSKGKLSEVEAEKIIRQTAAALSYMHQKRACHLDVKPANLLLTKEGVVKLADFGLSRSIDASDEKTAVVNAVSDGYAALEQYSTSTEKQFAPATDIYGLGATLYFLLSGYKPPSALEMVSQPFPKIEGVSERFYQAIQSAMRSTISERPATLEEWLASLEATGQPTKKRTFWKRLLRGVIVSVLIVLFLDLIYIEISQLLYKEYFHLYRRRLFPITPEVVNGFYFGVGSFVVFYCVLYEFVKQTDKARNLFSVLSGMIFYAVLVGAVFLSRGIHPNVVAWFTLSTAMVPVLVYFVRYVFTAKIFPVLFEKES